MKKTNAAVDYMTQTGSSLLKIMHDPQTPVLDLLVRESIQNSLDAASPTSESDYVEVSFNSYDLDTSSFSGIFGDVRLASRYPGMNRVLAIRDRYTTGLTGPTCYSEVDRETGDMGNFMKLVYEIARPQQAQGAGGSWGYGKTIFYRIGIGLVVFYSRIFDTKRNAYQSRLAAVLVEDEHAPNSVITYGPNEYKRGIAWWGERDSEGRAIPITDEYEINQVLKAFEVEPYQGSDTGTTVIIPFVKEQDLLHELVEEENEEHPERLNEIYWIQSLDGYLKIAIKRWYCLRLQKSDNAFFDKYLRAHVNGESVVVSDEEPLFNYLQILYNTRGDTTLENGVEIISKAVNTRGTFEKQEIGWINFAKVSEANMQMTPPNNCYSPFTYITNKEQNTNQNRAIIAFTRKPGMVIGYDYNGGDWTKSIPLTDKSEYIIGLFIPDSNVKFKNTDLTLEEYLRGSEAAVHNGWNDTIIAVSKKKQNVVTRIQSKVNSAIKDTYSVSTKKAEHNDFNFKLGRKFANIFLPQSRFAPFDKGIGGISQGGGVGGSLPSKETTKKESSKGRKSKHLTINIDGNKSIIYGEDNVISMPVIINMGSFTDAKIEFLIQTELGNYDSRDFADSGVQFPLKIVSIDNVSCKNPDFIDGEFSIMSKYESMHNQDLIIAHAEPAGMIIKCTIVYKIDPQYRGTLKISEVEQSRGI